MLLILALGTSAVFVAFAVFVVWLLRKVFGSSSGSYGYDSYFSSKPSSGSDHYSSSDSSWSFSDSSSSDSSVGGGGESGGGGATSDW